MNDGELMEMQRDWQRLGDVATATHELARRARNEDRKARRSLVIESLACAASSGFLGWVTVRTHGTPSVVVLTAAVLLFNGMYLAKLFETRSWNASYGSRGLEAFATALQRHLASRKKWLHFVWRSTLMVSVGLVAWIPWWIGQHLELYRRESWRALLGVSIALVVLGGVLWWIRRSQHEVERAVAQLDAELARMSLD